MYVKKKYEAKGEPAGFVEFINAAYNAYCEPTPDGLLLEVTLIGSNGAAATTAAVNVAKPLTEEKISSSLQYAALKAIHDYVGNNLVSPAKDDGASTKKVRYEVDLATHKLSFERHFNGAAASILQRVSKE